MVCPCPLPLLQRRLQTIDFSSGIQNSAFNMLNIKVANFLGNEKLCSVKMDEMAIQLRYEYDQTTGAMLGHVTLPDHHGKVTHLLFFMLAGITTRWKRSCSSLLLLSVAPIFPFRVLVIC